MDVVVIALLVAAGVAVIAFTVRWDRRWRAVPAEERRARRFAPEFWRGQGRG